MSIASLLKRLTTALPAVLAATPGVIEAVKQVKQALKKPKKRGRDGADGAAGADARPLTGRRLSADSGQGPV